MQCMSKLIRRFWRFRFDINKKKFDYNGVYLNRAVTYTRETDYLETMYNIIVLYGFQSIEKCSYMVASPWTMIKHLIITFHSVLLFYMTKYMTFLLCCFWVNRRQSINLIGFYWLIQLFNYSSIYRSKMNLSLSYHVLLKAHDIYSSLLLLCLYHS